MRYLSTRDLSTGYLSTRDTSTGDLSTRDLYTGDLYMRDLSSRDLSTGDLSTRDLSTRDLSSMSHNDIIIGLFQKLSVCNIVISIGLFHFISFNKNPKSNLGLYYT